MKLLLENWRNYLKEGMKTWDNLPDNVVVAIKSGERSVEIYYADADNPDNYAENPDGNVIITNRKPTSMDKHMMDKAGIKSSTYGPCDNAWRVVETEAQSGWGPLLYDIAIEFATLNGSGLTPDRINVSDEAESVWDYYSKSRGDVTSHQLDDLDNTLTPQEKDNCLQHAAAQVSSDFSDSSLSKRYTKEPTTIKSLGDKLKNLQENRK